jgi:hypothetical protein
VTHLQFYPRRKGYRNPAEITMMMVAPISLYLSPKQREGGREGDRPKIHFLLESIPFPPGSMNLLFLRSIMTKSITVTRHTLTDEPLVFTSLADRKGASKKHVQYSHVQDRTTGINLDLSVACMKDKIPFSGCLQSFIRSD